MSRTNPLFVDSTKLHGETITTQIELDGVLLRDGEKVFAKVETRTGEVNVLPLSPVNERLYSGGTWLKHQEEITLQFFISHNQVVILSSKPKRVRVSYVICESWQPLIAGVVVEKEETPHDPVAEWKSALFFDWR